MPALYRMPVTYLVLVLMGLGWLTYRLMEGPVPRTEITGVEAPSADEPDAPAPSPSIEPARVVKSDPPQAAPAPDLIRRTPDGLRRKVVVTELDVSLQPTPDTRPLPNSKLDYLSIRYVFDETRTMVQVGEKGVPEGWIPRSATLEWDTRLMARPTPRAGRPSIVIYEDPACLEAVVAGRLCPNHGGRCPTVGEEEPNGPEPTGAVLGWPILSMKGVKTRAGLQTALLEVAPLVSDRPPPPTTPPPDMVPALRTVYIGFVIDTTASMQATIDSVRELARRLADEARQSYPNVTLRLGLVVFRDQAPGFGYVAKRVSGFTDAAGFSRALMSIEAARRGDGSVDESVLEGVALALPGGPDHLDWPTGREALLATKVLVLIGDAPDHDRDLIRTGSLAAQARNDQITIATIALKSPTPLSRDEKGRFESQWKTLAETSYRPLDPRTGFAQPLPAQYLRLEEVKGLSGTLTALIDARVSAALKLAELAAAEAEGRLTEYVNGQGLTPGQVAPVLVDLHKGQAAAGSQADLRVEGRKAPRLRRGWIAQSREGKDLVTVQMLLSASELDLLIAELTSLQQVARGSPGDTQRLIELETAAASGETTFLAADRGRQTFVDYMKRREGVAPSRGDSLLRRSKTDLLRADPIEREALDRRLSESLLGLIRRRDDPDWTTPGRTIEGKALVPFAWIDF